MCTIIRLKSVSLCFVFVAIIAGCEKKSAIIPDSPVFQKYTYASALSKKVVDKVNLVKTVVADTLVELAPGVKQTILNYIGYDDKPATIHVLEVDLNNPRIKLKAGTPNNSNAFSKQVVADIALAQDKPNNRVIAAINGDFFNTATGEPQSILFKNGTAVKPYYKLCALCTFLSIDDAGKATIAAKDKVVDTTKIKDAIGGYQVLIKDTVRVTQGDLSVEPRSAVGVTAGNVVYFVVVDGRQPSYSNGMSFAQLSNVYSALGVKDAINLDGGGSTTLVVKDGTGWKVRNRPSDGVPRPVANAWTIVDTQ
jgi:exopolysaccharide biosynthesis protein